MVTDIRSYERTDLLIEMRGRIKNPVSVVENENTSTIEFNFYKYIRYSGGSKDATPSSTIMYC